MKQSYIIASIIFKKALRSHLISAIILLSVPTLLAAWIFETNNPDFQTGFISDFAGFVMSFFSIIMLLIYCNDNYYWFEETSTPWFMLTRTTQRRTLLSGIFLGFCMILFTSIIFIAVLFVLLMYYTTSRVYLEVFYTAYFVFLKFTLLASTIMLVSQFVSKLLTFGGFFILFFVAEAQDYVRTLFLIDKPAIFAIFAEMVLALLPDLALFSSQPSFSAYSTLHLLSGTLYWLFMLCFYMIVSEIAFNNKDL